MNGGSAEREESARNILFFLASIYHQKKRGFGIRGFGIGNGRKERRCKELRGYVTVKSQPVERQDALIWDWENVTTQQTKITHKMSIITL